MSSVRWQLNVIDVSVDSNDGDTMILFDQNVYNKTLINKKMLGIEFVSRAEMS